MLLKLSLTSKTHIILRYGKMFVTSDITIRGIKHAEEFSPANWTYI